MTHGGGEEKDQNPPNKSQLGVLSQEPHSNREEGGRHTQKMLKLYKCRMRALRMSEYISYHGLGEVAQVCHPRVGK